MAATIAKQALHIEIVRSGTPSLSSMGADSAAMIQALLVKHYETVGISLVSNLEELDILVAKQPDLVFIGVKYIPTIAGKVWIADYLDQYDIAYTGSPAEAIALDFDKPHAKQVVAAAGLATAHSFVASSDEFTAATMPLAYPLFVKPPNTGGGKGIGADSVVHNFAAFASKVQAISQEFQTVSLAEAYLPGREFSVAIMQKLHSTQLTAMPIELITQPNADGDRILGETVKAADTEHVVAVTDIELHNQLSTFAKQAFRALGGRGYGRIDIRLDAAGKPHFLEANLIPGLAMHSFISYFTAACIINLEISYETMILHLVAISLQNDHEQASTGLALATAGH